MNSDEDPSFAFICEGSSAVLGIFGESAGGLADMSTGSGVADLEAVFAKAAASLPAQPTSPSETKAGPEKLTTNNDLSDFQVETTALPPVEEPNKGMPVVEPSNLEVPVGLAEEIHKVLDPNPTLATGNSVVPEESSKNEERSMMPATVAGSVELAEEIMEVFANTKAVLDSENVVSKLDSCQEGLINDPCSLQEELDSLEQLAMERVREIEGELVNSTKQIADSHLSVNDTKPSKPSDLAEEIPKINVEVTALTEITVNQSDDSNNEKLKKKDSVSVTEDLHHASSENIAVVNIDETVTEENSQKSLPAVETCEPLKDITLVQQSISSDLLCDAENTELLAENSMKESNRVDEVYKFEAMRGPSSDKGRVDKEKSGGDVISSIEKESQKLFVSENKVIKNFSCVQNITELPQRNEDVPSNENKKVFENTAVDTPEIPLTESEPQNSPSVESQQPTKPIEDIQSYETEDDDLEVLEAFIVKSATNPELAMCTTNIKDNSTEKYSLESSLIDDLTKADNDNGTNDVVNNLTDETNSLNDKSLAENASPNEATPQIRLSQALERASQKIASVLNDMDLHSNIKSNVTGRRAVKQNVSLSNDKQLPLKKRLSQIDSRLQDTASREHRLKGTGEESREKKVVVEVVVKRRGRPPGTGKKQLVERKSMATKGRNHGDLAVSQSPAVEKVTQNLSSGKTTKKVKEAEESLVHAVTDTKIRGHSMMGHKSTASHEKQEKISNVSVDSNLLARKERQSREHTPSSTEAARKERRKVKESVETLKVKRNGSELKEGAARERRRSRSSSPAPSSAVRKSGREKRKMKDDEQSKIPAKKIDDGSGARKAQSSSTRNTLKCDANVQKLKPQGHEKHGREKNSPNSNSVSDVTLTRSRKVSESRENLAPVKRSPVGVKTSGKIPESNFPKSSKNEKRKVEENIEKTSPKRARVKGESKDSILNLTKEQELGTHSVSTSMAGNLGRMMDIYSDISFAEFENITFDMLQSEAKQLVLPTPLWGVHVDKGQDLVIFSRVCAQLSDDKPLIDKALVFQRSLKPVALIMNEPADLPIPSLRTFEDVVLLIRNFHSVSFCEGTGIKQRPQSKYCFRYLDVANPGSRCSQCLEERRRVLFGFARKLRERLRLLRAGRNL